MVEGAEPVALPAPPQLLDLDLAGCVVGGDPEGPWPIPEREVGGRHSGGAKRLEAWAARALLGFFGRLPGVLLAPVLGGLARLARRLDRRRSGAAGTFLRQALGEDGAQLERRVLDAWRHFFRLAADAVGFDRRCLGMPLAEHYRVRASACAREVLESGAGCLLVGAHLGDWEAGLPALAGLGFTPLYAVGKPPQNHYLALELQALRQRRGMRLLARRGAMGDVPGVVRAGGAVVMLLDQRAARRPVMAPFFGRLARCDRSAGVLLRRLGAPVVLFSCLRAERPGQFELNLGPVINPEDVAGLKPEAVATLLNGHLERMILDRPDQYFWLHDRYRDTPAEEREPAAQGMESTA
jgi:KDO2-lipid IV(A) lauroyltransferase